MYREFFFYLFLLPLGIVQRGFGKDKKKSERVKIRLTRDNKWQIPSATFVLRLSPCLRIQCSRLGRAGLPVGHFSAISLPSSYNLKSFFKNHFVLSHGNAGKNDLWWFCRRWRRFRVNARRILKMWVRVCVFVDVLVLLKLRSSERNGFTIFNVHFALLWLLQSAMALSCGNDCDRCELQESIASTCPRELWIGFPQILGWWCLSLEDAAGGVGARSEAACLGGPFRLLVVYLCVLFISLFICLWRD